METKTNGELIKCDILSDPPALPAESLAAVNTLIRISQTSVRQVVTIGDKQMATARGVQMQKWIKDVTEAKKRVKAPLNLLADNIDALAEQLLTPAITEKERLGRLITQFDVEDAKRIEAEKVERDKRIKAAQEEADRLALEALAKAGEMTDESQLEAAIHAENAARDAASTERELIVAPVPVSERVKGTVAGKSMTWKVTDIDALFKARPDLCKIEPYPALIRLLVVEGLPPIPGLEVVWEKRTTFRA